ncbi:hypothetical protein ST37_16900 [Vibrio sp. qd031]|uniref:MarR family winged helix-turn-helix transcriptional regulator n=1 Tax=Vibrio sp. qd031 TaxID=1603038 RepID=UPI000A0F715C|nr:MarR family transcriptional regulator [Vibrio sp. qd031]ORT48746.1 hypothetical protein ST37_16900 [Vibrio sp. qd031]
MQSSPAFQMYRVVQEYKDIVSKSYDTKFSLFEHFVLHHIESTQKAGCTQYEIAKVMHVLPARVNPVIKKLEKEGYVFITHDESTMRLKKIVVATAKGREIIDYVTDQGNFAIGYPNVPESNKHTDYLVFKRFLDYMYRKISDHRNGN